VFTERSIVRATPFALVLFLSTVACSSNNDSDITAPATSTTVNQSFQGTLTLNGARTEHFTVTASGSISAQLVGWDPNPNQLVGLSLGTWNGSLCQIVIDHPAAYLGQLVVGQTNATGDFCVRIYDAYGTIVTPQNYTILVEYQQAASQ